MKVEFKNCLIFGYQIFYRFFIWLVKVILHGKQITKSRKDVVCYLLSKTLAYVVLCQNFPANWFNVKRPGVQLDQDARWSSQLTLLIQHHFVTSEKALTDWKNSTNFDQYQMFCNAKLAMMISKLFYLRIQNSGLLTSKALIIAVAKTSASSLLEKLSPYTCLLSLHWWKVGVAWLYFKPFNIAQFMTTWKKNIVWLVGRDLCLYLMVLQLSSHHSEGVVYKMMINMNL